MKDWLRGVYMRSCLGINEFDPVISDSHGLIFGNSRVLCKFLDNLDLVGCGKQLRICHKCERLAEMNKLKFP